MVSMKDFKFNDLDYRNMARIWLHKNQQMTEGQIKSLLKVSKKEVKKAKEGNKEALLVIGRGLAALQIYY